MALSQHDINRAAIIAVLIINGKTPEELEEMQKDLATPEQCQEFATRLEEEFKRLSHSYTGDRLTQLCGEITARVQSNIGLRLSAQTT